MDKFTWGIIGPGSIAKEFAHDLSLIGHTQHRVGAVLSHTLEKAQAFAAEEHAPQYFENIESFLEKARVDAVYIATPHPLHYEETLQCLSHKIPVLCEKPLAMNGRQVSEMVTASAQHQTFLLEGMWIRFLPSIQKVMELIDNDVIGNVLHVRGDMSFKAPREEDSRYFNPELGGGSLLDLGIYPVYLSMLLLGKPEKIQAWARLSDQQIDESCAALLQYKNGVYALAESSIVMQTGLEATIYGEKGKIHILKPWNEKPEGIVVELDGGIPETHACEWEGRGFQYEAEEVQRCLEAGKLESEKFCHHFSVDLMETLDEIRRQTGIRYRWD